MSCCCQVHIATNMANLNTCFILTKFLVFLFIALPITCNEFDEIGIYPLKRHSFQRPFINDHNEVSSTFNNGNWEILGNAMLTRDYIRLTEDKPNQLGGVWNTIPIKFANWEVQIEFNISGHGKIFGDGIAFWYVKQPLQQGRVFGNADYFTGLGIFLDTFPNRFHGYNYPYISATLNNGSHSYDIDVDGKTTEFAGCEANLRNVTHRTMVSIRYYDGLLKVRTDVAGRDKWLLCFVSRIELPTGYFIGVTASTSHISDNHDLFELRTYKLVGTPPTSRDDQSVQIVMPKRYYGNSSSHGSISFTLAFISFLISVKFIIF